MMKGIGHKALVRFKLGRASRGQSLVEMAIAAPLLIFILIGLFEVGWAVRGYLALANANREATRFAVRPGYLNYAQVSHEQEGAGGYGELVGYDRVRDHVLTALGDQLNMDYNQNTTLIVSHLVVDTGWPCERPKNSKDFENGKWCACQKFDRKSSDYDPAYGFTEDDLIRYPGPGLEYYQYTYPDSSPVKSRYDFKQTTDELAADNNKFNCELLTRTAGSALPSANNFVITELFYNQPQLFGFPLISNPYTDPLPMYAHTIMRITGTPRTTDNVDTVGPSCMAWPFIIHKNRVPPPQNQKIDILGGADDPPYNSSGDWGWLVWNGIPDDQSDDAEYLENEIVYPRLSLNDFVNPENHSDTKLSVDDWVRSYNGTTAEVESSDGLISGLVQSGTRLRIPVFDDFRPGSGKYDPGRYHISGFIWVRIVSTADIRIPNKTILAVYDGDATDDCK